MSDTTDPTIQIAHLFAGLLPPDTRLPNNWYHGSVRFLLDAAAAEIVYIDGVKIYNSGLESGTDLERYQKWADRVWFGGSRNHQTNVMVAALGLAGETGEVCELLKKHHRGDGELDLHKLELELGDAIYYVARLASLHGLPLERIFESNVEKIMRRQERGTERGSGSER